MEEIKTYLRGILPTRIRDMPLEEAVDNWLTTPLSMFGDRTATEFYTTGGEESKDFILGCFHRVFE